MPNRKPTKPSEIHAQDTDVTAAPDKRQAYEAPAILSAEPLEVTATTCDGPPGPGKDTGGFDPCSTLGS